MSASAADIKESVEATRQVKKENLFWCSNYQDIPTLDDRLANFRAWTSATKGVCNKQNCLTIPESAVSTDDKLEHNNCTNVNLLMSYSISDNVKVCAVKKRAYGTLVAVDALRPQTDEHEQFCLAYVFRYILIYFF